MANETLGGPITNRALREQYGHGRRHHRREILRAFHRNGNQHRPPAYILTRSFTSQRSAPCSGQNPTTRADS